MLFVEVLRFANGFHVRVGLLQIEFSERRIGCDDHLEEIVVR